MNIIHLQRYFIILAIVQSLISCDVSNSKNGGEIAGVWVVHSINSEIRKDVTKEIKFNTDYTFEGFLCNSDGFFYTSGSWKYANDKIIIAFPTQNGNYVQREMKLGRWLVDTWMPPYDEVKYSKVHNGSF